ncbi:Myc-type, basic helix-loop-helix (bHLH) domain containing protein [Trema orientale]|uniref:Myc-type, basic helix-loop-helix (BHLH) domain containing protein n=1 Tax=Trema orientale TaxID=63057 RepID=A0A2P5ECG5_TREOI|nr:Myc-type, basic helix-loop-helix (bHLH) domain containing protein [Trema orientale]
MVSREHKRSAAALHEKLHLLRSITNSHALNKTSIILDASKYIEDLKQKVQRLNQDIANAQSTSSNHDQNALPPVQVTVETLEKGFLVNVLSEKSCPGLLVSVLEAFEDLGLNVLEARVSCADSFRLQAFGGENDEEGESSIMDAQAVKQAVMLSIKNWNETNELHD